MIKLKLCLLVYKESWGEISEVYGSFPNGVGREPSAKE
jgi:hypothetical protein